MSGAAGASGAAAAVAAHIANMKKMVGGVAYINERQLTSLLSSIDEAIVVEASGGWIGSWHKYLVNVSGIQFYCKTSEKVDIPERMHVITAAKISVPE